MDYTKETLEKLIELGGIYIVECTNSKPVIGYLTKSNYHAQGFKVLELNQTGGFHFVRSVIKRIICLNNWRIINKDDTNAKKLSYVDIFELNDLVKKAGYELI